MADTTRAPLELTVQTALEGWPVDVHLSLPAERVSAALARLAELGFTPRQAAAAAAAAPVGVANAQDRPEPYIDGDGDYACPVHRRKLSQGRYGWFCSAKAKPGEPANDKGYCTCSVKD